MECGTATRFLPMNGASWTSHILAGRTRPLLEEFAIRRTPLLCFKRPWRQPHASAEGVAGSCAIAVNAGKWPERRQHAL